MPYITADPDVVEKDIEDDDYFLVVASDGVWDAMSSDDVARFVMRESCEDEDGEKAGVGEPRVDEERLRWTSRKLCVEAEKQVRAGREDRSDEKRLRKILTPFARRRGAGTTARPLLFV